MHFLFRFGRGADFVTFLDANVRFLIEVIQRPMPRKAYKKAEQPVLSNDSMQAFQGLNAARGEIWDYPPTDFDPDRELKEAISGCHCAGAPHSSDSAPKDIPASRDTFFHSRKTAFLSFWTYRVSLGFLFLLL